MSENDGGTNQRNMYASPVGTMAPSNLRYWGERSNSSFLIDVLTHVCRVPQSVLFIMDVRQIIVKMIQ